MDDKIFQFNSMFNYKNIQLKKLKKKVMNISAEKKIIFPLTPLPKGSQLKRYPMVLKHLVYRCIVYKRAESEVNTLTTCA